MYKGPIGKAKEGKIEGGRKWWWENGDNYTQTTVKK